MACVLPPGVLAPGSAFPATSVCRLSFAENSICRSVQDADGEGVEEFKPVVRRKARSGTFPAGTRSIVSPGICLNPLQVYVQAVHCSAANAS